MHNEVPANLAVCHKLKNQRRSPNAGPTDPIVSMPQTHDILILGSGFGGSLLATILSNSGMSVALVDRQSHPRFAIGESSTPLADQTLADLATNYHIPELLPLTKYGLWRQARPQLTCGPKRGFSYFGHQAGVPFDPDQQLLVSASDTGDLADTHWLRSDVDHFFFQIAQQYNVDTFTKTAYQLTLNNDRHWICEGTTPRDTFHINTPFVVDATGASGEVMNFLQIPDLSHELLTSSSALFAHFKNVPKVAKVLTDQNISLSQHPFPCDAAAVHHVLSDGWMWQLRFDDDSVSCGIMSCDTPTPTFPNSHRWTEITDCYPFLKTQFTSASTVRPDSGLIATARIQRLRRHAAGNNWAALPSTAGFIDPLHSTGISHTLIGIRRLANILLQPSPSRTTALTDYSQQIIAELRHIDRLVEGCYAALPNFRLFSNWCMVYFAAVTSDERVIFDNSAERTSQSFLRTTDIPFRKFVSSARHQLQLCINSGATPSACDHFETWLRTGISPWNQFGFLSQPLPANYQSTPSRDAPADDGADDMA